MTPREILFVLLLTHEALMAYVDYALKLSAYDEHLARGCASAKSLAAHKRWVGRARARLENAIAALLEYGGEGASDECAVAIRRVYAMLLDMTPYDAALVLKRVHAVLRNIFSQ